MNTSRQITAPDHLRLSRGTVDFLVPAAWVLRVEAIERPIPLPLSESWVPGLARYSEDRWLPVLDPLTASGGTARRRAVGALLAAPGGEPLAWCLADGPGVLEPSPDHAGRAHPALPWLLRLPDGPTGRARWLLDASAWAASTQTA